MLNITSTKITKTENQSKWNIAQEPEEKLKRPNRKLKFIQLLKRKVFSCLDNNHRRNIYFPQLLMGVPMYCTGDKLGIGKLGVYTYNPVSKVA